MEYKKENILVLIPNLGRGGAQQVFRDQFNFLLEKHHLIGCVFNWDDAFQEDRHSQMISLDIPGGKNVLAKIYFFLKRVQALRKIKHQYNINFSISHLEGADYINLFSKRKDKVICWIHGTKAFDKQIEGLLGTLRKKLLIPLTYRLADKIVTVSEGIRQELINIFNIPAAKIKTIHNSFALEQIATDAKQSISPTIQDLYSGTDLLITHCRLSRPKNLFSLIDIFIATKSQCRTKLMILGDGELREDILRYCATQKLRIYTVWEKDQPFSSDYDIYFMGYERNPYPYLSRATLYVMTSSWEGFPLSLCEAMASGVPVISSDCYTGPREIISPGLASEQPVLQPVTAPYGVLMPLATKETIKLWSDTVCAILKNTDLRRQMKEKGKQRILVFDRKKISDQWLNLIGELVH